MKRHRTNWVNSRSAHHRKMLTRLLFQGLLLGALVLSSPMSAAAQAIKTTMKELIPTAQTERVLTTHQSGRFGNPALWQDIQAGMKAKYGIDAQLNGSPAAPSMGQMLSVLIDDYRAGRKPARADIFSTGGEQLVQLAEAEVLERIDWKKYMPDLTSEEIAMGGASIAVGLAPYTLVYNPQIVKDPPKSLEATQPSILLMDEPLSNLDARLREEVRKEIRSLVTQLGVTVLYVTHDQMEAMALADRVGVMQNGNLLQQGSPEELYRFPAEPRVAQFFGSTNWIDGILETPSMVQSALGYLEVDDSRVCGTKGPVVVAVRPEDIQLTAAPSEDQAGNNRFSGQIISGVFFGDHRLYTVAINDQRLLVKTLTSVELTEKVYVSIPRDRLCAFPKEAALNGVITP
ncbi:MAG TPA: TOBE domain-containing protein [Candidatus Binatia bacterium]|nr:TOBE domain-containing protein [Candidatus Binatia bacterium]